MYVLQVADPNERSKRDASSNESDDSSSSVGDVSSSASDVGSSESDDSSSESDASSSASDDSSSESDDSSERDNTTPTDDISTESDSTTPMDDVSTESDSTMPVNECAVLGDYIEFDLSIDPDVPDMFDDILIDSLFFNISVITQTEPAFFCVADVSADVVCRYLYGCRRRVGANRHTASFFR